MALKTIVSSIALSLAFGIATAQSISLEASFYQGSIWRHTPKLSTQTGSSSGQELGIRFQTLGRHNWQAWQRYPSLGFSLSHFYLGEGSHTRAYGMLPWLNVPIFRKDWLAAHFRVGTGLGWVARPYDWWNNPYQNAVGSHWNNLTQFRLGAEAKLSKQFKLLAGGSFTHFSNGGTALPNFGINVISAWLGANWSLRPLQKADFRPANASRKTTSKRIGGLLQAGYTSVQVATFDGPKYPIWVASGSLSYRFNQLHRASFGMEMEKNMAIYEWGLHNVLFADEKAAARGSTRLALFLGEEFLFGDLGIQVLTGRYLGKKYNAFVPKAFYNKLSMRYYLPEKLRFPLRPFLGVTLKAHAFTAEYISWNLGFGF